MMKTITVNNIWDNIKNFKSNIKCIKVLNVRAKTINFQRKTLKEIFMTIHQSKICKSKGCSVVSDSLQPHGIYSPWNSPGQNTGVDSLSLLQGIFPTQASNPGLPHCRRILYQLSHKGSPKISKVGHKKHEEKIDKLKSITFNMRVLSKSSLLSAPNLFLQSQFCNNEAATCKHFSASQCNAGLCQQRALK